MTAPADREFRVLPRGDIRDRVILGNFRAGLRQLTNPETGLPFTEEEIARATQPRTRWFLEADALDSYGQGEQRRALFMADQVRVDRASTAWLEGYHAKLWRKPKLPASGGAGSVIVRGTPGTAVIGSTTIPDQSAYSARDPKGKVYQVLSTGFIQTGGTTVVQMVSRDTGADTNPIDGTVLSWITRDPGMAGEAIVLGGFAGGNPVETDLSQTKRIASAIQHKEGAGNSAQFRAWGRDASSAIEEAFIYPTALHSGSTVVAIVQRRGTSSSPIARLPSVATLQAAIQQLTPPGTLTVPGSPNVLVTGVQADPVPLYLLVALRKGSSTGWLDASPFPSYGYSPPAPHVSGAPSSPTVFTLAAPASPTLPQVAGIQVDGVDGKPYLAWPQTPRMMVWRQASSSFESLLVQKVKCMSPGVFEVTLNEATALSSGDIIIPECGVAGTIAAAVVAYMDRRGPGQLVTETDERWARCQRFPDPSQEWPTDVGADVAVEVMTALGGVSTIYMAGGGAPPIAIYSVPSGPFLLTLQNLGIYAL